MINRTFLKGTVNSSFDERAELVGFNVKTETGPIRCLTPRVEEIKALEGAEIALMGELMNCNTRDEGKAQIVYTEHFEKTLAA